LPVAERTGIAGLLAGCRVDLQVHAVLYTNRKNALNPALSIKKYTISGYHIFADNYRHLAHTTNRAKFLSTLESRTMRTVRNITIAVEPELYRQTRKIAADYDTTVTDMVRFLLLVLPEAVKAARYPGGRPQFGLAVTRATLAAVPSAAHAPNPPAPSLPDTPLPGKSQIPPCTPVNPTNQVSLQQLTEQESAPVQNKYSSTTTLKSLIPKILRAIF
jgi:hypothetical protein